MNTIVEISEASSVPEINNQLESLEPSFRAYTPNENIHYNSRNVTPNDEIC